MKTRWKILIGMVLFMVLVAGLALVTMRLEPENAVEAYKKLLRAKGEKLTLSEVLPPPVPPESNSVTAVQAAFGMLGSGSEKIPDTMKMVAPGKALIGWQQPEARGDDFTNTWAEFTANLETNRPAITLLHEILNYPRLTFPVDYQASSFPSLPLVQMRHAAQKLESATICAMHNSDPAEAVTNILTLLELVQKSEADGLLISQLVRIAIAAIAVVPTWELLQATNVTDAQLAAVQAGWARLNSLHDAECTFVTERAWSVAFIHKSRTSHEAFENFFIGGSTASSSGRSALWNWPPDWEAMTEGPRQVVAEGMWRSSWSYSAELHSLKGQQIILEALRGMQTNQSLSCKAEYAAMLPQLAALGDDHASRALFRILKIPDYSEIFEIDGLAGAVRNTIRSETARRIVITAIALKRFQLKHAHLPETLAALVPEFIPSIPIDPQDGQPLRYRRNLDGTFLLYSVGKDGKDDGGDPTHMSSGSSNLGWQNPQARDWVWPQPASEAEIKFFREHPPK